MQPLLLPKSRHPFSHLTMLSFIVAGYLALAGVIFFAGDINLTLKNGTVITASAQSVTTPLPVPPPVTSLEPTYSEYVQSILNDPANFKQEKLLPGRAYLEGKTTKFLIGF